MTGRLAGARPLSVRGANLALVLGTVCAAEAPPSRADVAGITGMARATVARLVDELVAARLLDEVERPPTTRRGRPATPLAPGARYAGLGLQVDAGLLAARILDLRGRVVAEQVEDGDFTASDPAPTLERLGALALGLIDSLPSHLRLVGAGLALPGIVDVAAGALLRAPNLGWIDQRPADVLARSLPAGLVPTLGNEADLAARTVASTAPGRAGPYRHFLYLSGQIGIGGAAVLGGRVMTGSSGWAGEVGHVCVDPDGPACRCGSTGCLERYAGRDALLAAAGLPRSATPGLLVQRATDGDPAALRAIDSAAWALGVALAGALNVLDIPAVVLGGNLGELGELLCPRVGEHLSRRGLSARRRRPAIAAAATAPGAGAPGAALCALDDVPTDPGRWLT